MNDSKTPKIVVGVGLLAVYSAIGFFLLRDGPGRNVALKTTTAPAAQMAGASIPPAAIPPASVDALPSVAEPPAVATEAPSPVASVAAKSVAAPAPQTERVTAPPPQAERVAAPPSQALSIAAAPQVEEPTMPSEQAEASPESEVSPPGQAVVAASGDDTQITAEVKTKIAAVAPASTIDVTTTNGVVELSGSVPSREEIDKVLLAARNVDHVRSVDASALMVSN